MAPTPPTHPRACRRRGGPPTASPPRPCPQTHRPSRGSCRRRGAGGQREGWGWRPERFRPPTVAAGHGQQCPVHAPRQVCCQACCCCCCCCPVLSLHQPAQPSYVLPPRPCPSLPPSAPPDAQHVLGPVLVHLPRQRRSARAQRVRLSRPVRVARQHLGRGWIGSRAGRGEVVTRDRKYRYTAEAADFGPMSLHSEPSQPARLHCCPAVAVARRLLDRAQQRAPLRARRPTAGRRRSSGPRAGGSRGRWAAGGLVVRQPRSAGIGSVRSDASIISRLRSGDNEPGTRMLLPATALVSKRPGPLCCQPFTRTCGASTPMPPACSVLCRSAALAAISAGGGVSHAKKQMGRVCQAHHSSKSALQESAGSVHLRFCARQPTGARA